MALLVQGCASVRGVPAARPQPAEGEAAGSAAVVALPAGLGLQAEDFGTQRLFRLSYGGPEGQVSLRLTLRLLAADRYRLDAADPVGRLVWVMVAEGQGGVWVDHRAGLYCRFTGTEAPEFLTRTPFSLVSLPALLLGRLPVEPVPPLRNREQGFEFEGSAGRRWVVGLGPDGRLASWSLSEGAEPRAWWSQRGSEALLSERRGAQLRWRQTLVEPFAGPLPEAVIPAGYPEGCDRLTTTLSTPL
jgi:hypothetical protein